MRGVALRPRIILQMAGVIVALAASVAGRQQTFKSGAPTVRRRLWVVEDADGLTLQCSDAALQRCDELARTFVGISAVGRTEAWGDRSIVARS